MKYVNVDCEQINGKIKTRTIERHEIGSKLQASVKTWLKKLGYDKEDIDLFLNDLVLSNDIKCLPEDVQSKYKVEDCYVYVDDIWDVYNKLKDEIIETVTEINNKVKKYNELIKTDSDAAEKLFWDDDDSLKAQSYYYNLTIRPELCTEVLMRIN